MDAVLEFFSAISKEISSLSTDSSMAFLGSSAASLMMYGKVAIIIFLIVLILYAAFYMLFGT